MSQLPDLIYCASGNARFARIAIDAGYHYGAQMPGTVYFWPYFVDNDWKRPNRERYMAALAEHRPYMASVLDLEQESRLDEVLAWAEEAAQWVEVVMIIPKVFCIVPRIPRVIGGKPVRLGYSVPTRFGGTELPVWEFAGWPVHLLGGSPHRQMAIAQYMDVRSADGNYSQKMALEYSQFWTAGTATYAKNRYWPRLDEAGERVDGDAPYAAFERSCHNIMAAWRRQ
jgi:hypothetical protein